MSTMKTDAFAETHASQAWVEDLRQDLQTETSEEAWSILRATLKAVRQALPLPEVADLCAQFPLLIRGLFLEEWHPLREPKKLRNESRFFEAIQRNYGERTLDTRSAATAVFKVIEEHVPADAVADLKAVLPRALQGLWRGDADSGADESDEGPQMLKHVVGQFMTRDVLTTRASTRLQDALETMSYIGVRHLPVLDDRADGFHPRGVVGMLSNRDALAPLVRAPDENVRLDWLLVRDVMTHAPLRTIAPTAPLYEAAKLMHEEHLGALLVLEQQQFVGMLTSDDVLYAGSLVGPGETPA